MERRTYKRIPVHSEGRFISHNTIHVAYIRNVSEYGANAIFTPIKTTNDFNTETEHKLIIDLPSGATINLKCMGRWSSALSPQVFSKEIGLELIEPPLQYQDFLTTLK